MELNDIHHKDCPWCHARIRSITQENRHTNGHYNEYMMFECGHYLKFSPNFMAIEVLTQCPNKKEEIEKRENRQVAMTKLRKYVERMVIDQKHKDRIQSAIAHL